MSRRRIIATLDCETDPFSKNEIPEPFIFGVYNGFEYWQFTHPQDVVDFLSEKNWVVYAHNGGKFDYHFFLGFLNKYKRITVINGRLAKFKIGKCEFRDSYNILPVPLSTFNKTPFDYNKLKKENRLKHWKEIEAYLKDDCVYLHQFVTRFISEYGRKLTIASSALEQFGKMRGVEEENTTAGFFDTYSPYYAGGRVQCFKSGVIKGDIKLIDINSAYPYAMMHNHAHGKLVETFDELPEENIEQCFIKLSCVSKGAFYERQKNRLSYPTDNEIRTYHVTGWEYVTAKRLGLLSKEKIIQVYRFEKTIEFKKYVNHFFAQRKICKQNGDKGGDIIAKLYLNSLYGKYASNPRKYREYEIIEPQNLQNYEDDDFVLSSTINAESILVERKLPPHLHRYYNVATAASITGFVRAYLLEAIASVETPLYCDTDSIFYTGKSSLKIGKELGQWDLEAEGYKMAIAGKKLYCLWKNDGFTKIASKGVRLPEKEIEKIACNLQYESLYENEAPIFSLKKGIYFQPKKIKNTA